MKINLPKRSTAALLLAALMSSLTGCALIDDAADFIKGIVNKESPAEEEKADQKEGTDEKVEDEELYITDHFELDESFMGLSESEVNLDLQSWLTATYAILTEENYLQHEYIGGKSRGSANMDKLQDMLENDWGITDKDTLILQVDEMISREEITEDPGEDAYCLMCAEDMLGKGYATGLIEMDEYLSMAVPLGRMIQGRYSSWDEYGDAFVSYYINSICTGAYGNAEDIDKKADNHQFLVSAAEYYYGPYVIDFNLKLTNNTLAKSTLIVDPGKVPPEAEDRTPIAVEGYVSPRILGSKLTSGVAEIEGDLYHFPATVKAFMDKGWSLADESKDITLPEVFEEEITMTREGKNLTLKCEAVFQGATAVEKGLVPAFKSGFSNEDIEFKLPGNISCGMSRDQVDAILADNCDEDIEEQNRLGMLQYHISMKSVNETSGSAGIWLIFDGDLESARLKEITIQGDSDTADLSEGKFKEYVCAEFENNVKKSKESTETILSKRDGDRIELSDDPGDAMFQVGLRTFTLPVSAEDFTEGGWHSSNESDLRKKIKAGEDKSMYVFYQKGFDHMAEMGYRNNGDEDTSYKDSGFNYVYLTSFTSGDDKIPVKVAGGLQIGVSTGEDIVAAFGEADEVKEINTDDADLIDYYYEFDNCKYIFVTYKDSGIIETIHMYMK